MWFKIHCHNKQILEIKKKKNMTILLSVFLCKLRQYKKAKKLLLPKLKIKPSIIPCAFALEVAQNE